jgi:hypothetical protein
MSFAEVILNCTSCKKTFIFTVKEHNLRAAKGYPNEPLLCHSCRLERNIQRNQIESDSEKPAFSSRFLR